MAGFVNMVSKGPVHWKAYRLETTPLSSCQGEYIVATRAAIEAKALSEAIQFLTYGPVQKKAPIFCDNKSAVLLSESATSSKRLKHIATRIAFLREMVNAKEIALFWIPTDGQLADLFTKPLIADKFHPLRKFFVA